jgi:hypothetical protein
MYPMYSSQKKFCQQIHREGVHTALAPHPEWPGPCILHSAAQQHGSASDSRGRRLTG